MPPATLTVNAGDLLRIRGARNRLLGRHLFLPGAWDILLYLQCRDIPCLTEAICQALSMHASNADRWLAVLEEEGLVERARVPDGRTVFTLTSRAQDDLTMALSAGSY